MEEIITGMVNSIIDTVAKQYVKTAIWSSTDENGEMLDSDTEIDQRSLALMREDVYDFLAMIARERPSDVWPEVALNPGQTGHDFWLTRNRHGAGFWDGDWPGTVGTWLTEQAHVYGESELIPVEGSARYQLANVTLGRYPCARCGQPAYGGHACAVRRDLCPLCGEDRAHPSQLAYGGHACTRKTATIRRGMWL